MDEVFLSEGEVSALQGLIGGYPTDVIALTFEVSMDAVVTSDCDGPFGIVFSPRGLLKRLFGRGGEADATSYLTVENSLRDLPGALDTPKLVVKAPASLRHLKMPVGDAGAAVFSSLDLKPVSPVVSIEIWSTEMNAGGEDVAEGPPVICDTGLRIKLANGRSFVFAVNTSILCNVQLATQEAGQRQLLERMSLRRTLTAPGAKP